MNIGFKLRPAQTHFRLSALRRNSELLCRIDMWGFVSIMLVFLFLLMPWTVIDGGGPVADLPQALHSTPIPGALAEDAMQITVARDGRVSFGRHWINCEDLPNAIHESIRAGAERRVYLAADARAKYGDVRAVLDQIRASGIENISLLTHKP